MEPNLNNARRTFDNKQNSANKETKKIKQFPYYKKLQGKHETEEEYIDINQFKEIPKSNNSVTKTLGRVNIVDKNKEKINNRFKSGNITQGKKLVENDFDRKKKTGIKKDYEKDRPKKYLMLFKFKSRKER